MHYDLHLTLHVYQPNIIDSEAQAGIMREINKLISGQMKIEFIHNDGWDELDIKIQRQK